MKITVREMVSLAFGLGGIAMLGIAMSHVLDSGTCGTGGPHAIARECPAGSNAWGVLLPIGFFVWLTSFFISKGGLAKPGAGQITWTAGFLGGGLALLLKTSTQPSLGADSKLGSYIMAAIFIPMGIAIWIPALLGLRRGRRANLQPPPTDAAAAPDRGAWMRQLNRLRSSGALTRAEFDQLRDGPGTNDDRLALIQQLSELKASGILTTAEFQAKKRTVLLGGTAGRTM
jgi:hypothetical protein